MEARKNSLRSKLFRSAATICAMTDWETSNLSLQKLLYISHMLSMGDQGLSLIEGYRPFQAWDMGPVQPDLYHTVKGFGAEPIPDIFPHKPFDEGEPEHRYISHVVKSLGSADPAQLVHITHWEKGAWAKNYQSGVRYIEIPERDIIKEYSDRFARPS